MGSCVRLEIKCAGDLLTASTRGLGVGKRERAKRARRRFVEKKKERKTSVDSLEIKRARSIFDFTLSMQSFHRNCNIWWSHVVSAMYVSKKSSNFWPQSHSSCKPVFILVFGTLAKSSIYNEASKGAFLPHSHLAKRFCVHCWGQ